jgi:hypothetical protein
LHVHKFPLHTERPVSPRTFQSAKPHLCYRPYLPAFPIPFSHAILIAPRERLFSHFKSTLIPTRRNSTTSARRELSPLIAVAIPSSRVRVRRLNDVGQRQPHDARHSKRTTGTGGPTPGPTTALQVSHLSEGLSPLGTPDQAYSNTHRREAPRLPVSRLHQALQQIGRTHPTLSHPQQPQLKTWQGTAAPCTHHSRH